MAAFKSLVEEQGQDKPKNIFKKSGNYPKLHRACVITEANSQSVKIRLKLSRPTKFATSPVILMAFQFVRE